MHLLCIYMYVLPLNLRVHEISFYKQHFTLHWTQEDVQNKNRNKKAFDIIALFQRVI